MIKCTCGFHAPELHSLDGCGIFGCDCLWDGSREPHGPVITLDKWSFDIHGHLGGIASGDPRPGHNGQFISTSSLRDYSKKEDCFHTRSGSKYRLGTIDPDYLKYMQGIETDNPAAKAIPIEVSKKRGGNHSKKNTPQVLKNRLIKKVRSRVIAREKLAKQRKKLGEN